jgi:integrase
MQGWHWRSRRAAQNLALTGARPGDLRGARKSQFDSRTASISFFAKNHPRTVPLPRAALPLFERLAKDKLPNAWLFARDDGKPWVHSDWDELVRAAAKRSGLPNGVCLDTLRHSFITQALMDGVSTLDIAHYWNVPRNDREALRSLGYEGGARASRSREATLIATGRIALSRRLHGIRSFFVRARGAGRN